MPKLLRSTLLVMMCLVVFMPVVQADTVAPTAVDALEDVVLQQLDAQTSQVVEDIQGGLSETWGIVGVVLVALIAVSIIL